MRLAPDAQKPRRGMKPARRQRTGGSRTGTAACDRPPPPFRSRLKRIPQTREASVLNLHIKIIYLFLNSFIFLIPSINVRLSAKAPVNFKKIKSKVNQSSAPMV